MRLARKYPKRKVPAYAFGCLMTGGFFTVRIPRRIQIKARWRVFVNVLLRMCKKDGVPAKKPQGKFALRLDPETYYDASVATAADGVSLNQWIAQTVREAVRG
jgi:hypothetical protein